ncbi:5-demethoxyubiquinol-8 5-hydroxylase UbiM [Luteimonas dalianensis]|uniref:5-demethoxyubiquinol-8 5-hydroxylase UbiM n=1 Tax=Luteimonas dalianensis TaxID=1148196 RepID=UPI003BF0D580
MQFDVVVVGAGPAGLCFARSLAGSGLSVAVVEKQPLQAIQEPAFDGREIALTHASRGILEQLGLWERFDAAEVSELRDAKVSDGDSAHALRISSADGRSDRLGWLVPNHVIRRTVYEAVARQDDLELVTGCGVQSVAERGTGIEATLEDGRVLRARLLVAADSRFSQVRRMLGIGATMRDHGKRMMVCRFEHTLPHHHVAWEWFDYGHTLALLPLNGNLSSAVLTLGPGEMDRAEAMDDAALAADLQRRMRGERGEVTMTGTSHVYPLVSVYAERFVARRAALVGDAAVGMHPVTAHGFNLGLQGQARLAEVVLQAHREGADIGSDAVLARYQRRHNAVALPIYAGTRTVVELYSNQRPLARVLRRATLRVANRLPPFRRAIAAHLTQG